MLTGHKSVCLTDPTESSYNKLHMDLFEPAWFSAGTW